MRSLWSMMRWGDPDPNHGLPMPALVSTTFLQKAFFLVSHPIHSTLFESLLRFASWYPTQAPPACQSHHGPLPSGSDLRATFYNNLTHMYTPPPPSHPTASWPPPIHGWMACRLMSVSPLPQDGKPWRPHQAAQPTGMPTTRRAGFLRRAQVSGSRQPLACKLRSLPSSQSVLSAGSFSPASHSSGSLRVPEPDGCASMMNMQKASGLMSRQRGRPPAAHRRDESAVTGLRVQPLSMCSMPPLTPPLLQGLCNSCCAAARKTSLDLHVHQRTIKLPLEKKREK